MQYAKGQEITCPHCGKDTVIKVRPRMDGWTKVGDIFACALCDAELAAVAPEQPLRPPPPNRDETANRFAALLGTEKEVVAQVVDDDGVRRFCRDCRHYFHNPFINRCLLHDRETRPMQDCADFERRSAEPQPPDDEDS